MNKLIGIIVCMLLIATVLSVSGTVIVERTPISTSLGDTLYVGGSGPGNYSTIQEAIDNASDDDTVFVYDDSSPYYENVLVDKSITLIGEDKETTIIDGNENGNVVFITADMVTISGFTIMNSKDERLYAGVDIYANYTTISDNIIKDNYIGIALWHNGDSNYGVILYGNVIINNIISSNTLQGIWVHFCEDSTVTNNIITNSGFAIHNVHSSDNLLSGNIISNNEAGITVYQGSNNNKISGNSITNNEYYGIFIYFSCKNDIHQNNIIESGKRNAKFLYDIKNLKRNNWRDNYWGSPMSSPYLIFGRINILIGFGVIPWFEIDWHPALEPYDI